MCFRGYFFIVTNTNTTVFHGSPARIRRNNKIVFLAAHKVYKSRFRYLETPPHAHRLNAAFLYQSVDRVLLQRIAFAASRTVITSGVPLKYDVISLSINDLLLPLTGIFVRMFTGDFPLLIIVFTVPVFIAVLVRVLEIYHSVALADDIVCAVSQPAKLVRGNGTVYLFN